MATIRIAGGRVIDPSQNIDEITDVWLKDGKVLGVGRDLASNADETIDATDLIVCPGLIDIHVHFREPGDNAAETIATGAASALAGGVTTVACMPNTNPALDTQGAAEFVILQAQRARQANVYPVGAVSKQRAGQELAELGALVDGGAVAFSDDGSPVESAELMRRALEYSRMFDKPIMQHCQVMELTTDGVMNEGLVSTQLGMPGMPAAAEDIMVARDIRLSEITGGHVHIQHISTARAIELVRDGKKRGVNVTAEACPHHFTLTDECLRTFDTNYKMNPPLRTQEDVDAVIEGLVDGSIEILATDHAPHTFEKKAHPIDQAPFGIVGLETFLPISAQALVETGKLTWPEFLAKLTIHPARLLRMPNKGTLRTGSDADVTIIDANRDWIIDPKKFRSKSRNTPYGGWQVKARAKYAIVAGEVRYRLAD